MSRIDCDNSCASGKPAPAPSPQPEMPEGWYAAQFPAGHTVFVNADGIVLGLDFIHALLATQGLTIVGPAERKVLEACITGVREYYEESGGYTNGNGLADDLRAVLRDAGLM